MTMMPRSFGRVGYELERPLRHLFAVPALVAGYAMAQGWVQIPSPPCANQSAFGMAYDEHAGVTVAAIPCNAAASQLETWLYDGVGWTSITTGAPSYRAGHVMAYDRVRQRIVLFGGVDAGNQALGDTWLWDGTAWSQAQPTHSPTPTYNYNAAMAFDDYRGVMVMFCSGPQGGETWEWDGTDWAQRLTSAMPVMNGVAMAYDPAVRKVRLYGGGLSGGSRFAAEFDGVDWLFTPQGGLAPLVWFHGLAYDTLRGQLVVVGGRLSYALPNSNVYEQTAVGWVVARYQNSSLNVASVVAYDSLRGVIVHGSYAATWRFEELVPNVASFASTGTCSDGTRPSLAIPSALPSLGASLHLDLRNLPQPCFSALGIGWGMVQAMSLPGTACSMYFTPLAWAGLAGSGGSVQYPLMVPASASMAGLQFWLQAAVVDPAANSLGVTLSNALRVTVY